MNARVLFGLAVACTSMVPAAAQTFDPSADPVFTKMLAVNKGLHSYTANIDVATRLPLGSFTLHGTLYDKGDQSKVVFVNVPSIARSSVENQPSIGAATTWTKRYTISVVTHTPDATTYRLVPIASEGVRHIDAVVESNSGLVREYVWSNDNGMTITSDQTYEAIGAYQLVASTSTKTRGAGVHADSTTTFTNYELNVAVPDSAFTANQ